MKIFDGIVLLASIAVMILAITSGAELPMSVKFLFLCVGSMTVLDFFDR